MAESKDNEKFYESGPIEALGAPPPPPPPPPVVTQLPRKSPGDTDAWMRKTLDEIKTQPLPPGMALAVASGPAPPDLVRQLAEHRSWLERLEREIVELKAARSPAAGPAPPSGVVPAGMLAALSEATPEPLELEDARLRADLFAVRAELERTRADLERARSGSEPRPSGDLKTQLSASDKALDAVRAELKQVTEENEHLEGELQSLKLQLGDTREKTRAAVAAVTDLKLDAKAEVVVRQIVVDRDKLQEEKTALEKDLNRLKSEATKRLNSLKGEVEKATKQSETIRLQKENLLRQLQERDARGLGESSEITLEDITSSEVFKTMLGNIRRTSRAEVTTFHEAVASLRAIDPRVYEVVLEVVAKHFQKAQIENPLATLPRG